MKIGSRVGRLWLLILALLVPLSADAQPRLPPDPSLSGPPLKFRAELSPDEESHVTISPATGVAEFMLKRETMTLSWTIAFEKLKTPPTIAHAHGPQTPGGNAGILFPLADGPIRSPIKGAVVLTEGQLDYLLTGRVYVNIHTQGYPDGELRGQIMRVRTDRPTQ